MRGHEPMASSSALVYTSSRISVRGGGACGSNRLTSSAATNASTIETLRSTVACRRASADRLVVADRLSRPRGSVSPASKACCLRWCARVVMTSRAARSAEFDRTGGWVTSQGPSGPLDANAVKLGVACAVGRRLRSECCKSQQASRSMHRRQGLNHLKKFGWSDQPSSPES